MFVPRASAYLENWFTDIFQVDLSSLNTFQQSILFALLILGHSILISITVLFVRNRAFHSKFQGISKNRAPQCPDRGAFAVDLASNRRTHEACVGVEGRGVELTSSKGDDKPNVTAQETPAQPSSPKADDDHIRWVEDDQVTIGGTKLRHHHNHHPHRVFPMVGVGARLDLNNHPRDVPPNLPIHEEEELTGLKGIFRGTQKYFSSKGFVSRNSSFHGLTPAERDELGGVEYRAVSFLSVIVPLYWLSFLLLGIIGVGGWLEANHPEIPRSNGLSPFWTGAFFAVSAFVNSGMSLLDKNMTALQTKYVYFNHHDMNVLTVLQDISGPDHGYVDSCRKHTLPVFPTVHHLDDETHDTGLAIMERVEGYFGFHLGASEKSM